MSRTKYPEHIRRVRPLLIPGVKIKRTGSGHRYFFFIGRGPTRRFTWTSCTPRSREDEYQQLLRRLRTEGMLKNGR